jgi:predicted enzyme related to lactoylglutathione lyase
MSKHPIVHIELSAKDREALGNFYTSLFGWKVEQIPDMNYALFEAEGGPGGGLNPVSEQYPEGTVMVYIQTDDIDASLARVEELGGQLTAPKQDVPDVGWIAIFKDPSGNQLALLEPTDQEG